MCKACACRCFSLYSCHSAQPKVLCCRGGPLASTHVESLGNVNLMRDVVKVAAGVGHTLKDDIYSTVSQIAAHINCFDDDTC